MEGEGNLLVPTWHQVALGPHHMRVPARSACVPFQRPPPPLNLPASAPASTATPATATAASRPASSSVGCALPPLPPVPTSILLLLLPPPPRRAIEGVAARLLCPVCIVGTRAGGRGVHKLEEHARRVVGGVQARVLATITPLEVLDPILAVDHCHRPPLVPAHRHSHLQTAAHPQ